LGVFTYYLLYYGCDVKLQTVFDGNFRKQSNKFE